MFFIFKFKVYSCFFWSKPGADWCTRRSLKWSVKSLCKCVAAWVRVEWSFVVLHCTLRPAWLNAVLHLWLMSRIGFRQESRERSTTFTTPRGLTLGCQNLLPPSSTSSSRFGSLARWARSMGPWWCTAALESDARGASPWWTPVWSWYERGRVFSLNAEFNTEVV